MIMDVNPALVLLEGFSHSPDARASWRGAMGWRIRPWRLGQSAIAAAAEGKRSFNRIPWTHGLQVCVVGSGPAGFYTAEKLLKRMEKGHVDILERLPTPFGLVRSGVSPDHPETKVVINQFSRVAINKRCAYFGNVTLGTDVSLEELRKLYNVVVLAYGAESDRKLGIPGEELTGVHSAREFVWWYNGHPDGANLQPDLQSTDTVAIIGQGNVAVDAARILLRSPEELATTDIAEHALATLRESCVRRVYLVGRRGPVQAACNAKELRELLGIKGLAVKVHDSDLTTSPADLGLTHEVLPVLRIFLGDGSSVPDRQVAYSISFIGVGDISTMPMPIRVVCHYGFFQEEMKASRKSKRVYELFVKAAAQNPSASLNTGGRELPFAFFRSPTALLPSEDGVRVAGVKLEKTILQGERGKDQRAVGIGQFEDLPCGLVLKSIGYKSLPVPGLTFDHKQGVVPNVGGRVLSSMEQGSLCTEAGLYVVGWLRRGPSGVIGTNLIDAEETVETILEDEINGVLTNQPALGRSGGEALQAFLKERGIPIVTFEDWLKIDAYEVAMGKQKGKLRQKIISKQDMLMIAKQVPSHAD